MMDVWPRLTRQNTGIHFREMTFSPDFLTQVDSNRNLRVDISDFNNATRCPSLLLCHDKWSSRASFPTVYWGTLGVTDAFLCESNAEDERPRKRRFMLCLSLFIFHFGVEADYDLRRLWLYSLHGDWFKSYTLDFILNAIIYYNVMNGNAVAALRRVCTLMMLICSLAFMIRQKCTTFRCN